MKDITRDHAMALQKGVRDSKRWEWGPFAFFRTEYQFHLGYVLTIKVGRSCIQLGWTQPE